MRRAGLAVIVALSGFAACAAGESHRNFAGTWKMDAARSESAHQDVPIGPSILIVRLTDTGLSMETTVMKAASPPHFMRR